MSRRHDLSRPVPRIRPLPDDLTDQQWWDDAEQRYREYEGDFTGSPESFAVGARWFYASGEFGAAALMYQKAIYVLHSIYTYISTQPAHDSTTYRLPSPSDLPIMDGYKSSLGATVSLHPDAPVNDSISKVVSELSDIFFTCKRADIPAGLYGNALLAIEPIARRYGILIDRRSFTDPRGTVINNHGIMASGASVVSHVAFASGEGAHAEVSVPASAAPEAIRSMLRQFMEELTCSQHADKDELAAMAQEACQELDTPNPRPARLRVLTSGLAAVVRGTGSLASLALQIEHAIRGL